MMISIKSSLLIALLWAFFLGTAILGARDFPGMPVPGDFPPATVAIIVLLPIVFFAAMSFWGAHSPFYHPTLARIINARFGHNALESFLVRLKPLLLFASAAALQSILGILHGRAVGATQGTYVIAGFFLSGAMGFALAHAILFRRRAVGVFPTRTLTEAEPIISTSPPKSKTLREVFRLYWWVLIGLALFPAVAFIASDFFHVPFEYLAVVFLAVGTLAAWPCWSGRAPFSFWIVAGVVYLMGGVLGGLLVHLIQTIRQQA